MAKGYALHIALNSVNPTFYKGNSGFLNVCKNDALAYSKIAQQQNFQYIKLLIDKDATTANFKNEINFISKSMSSEDYFLLSFSGHGSKNKDINGDEDDGEDESWCFYDGKVLDDELYRIWPQFEARSRVYVVSDSCYSGTILKDIFHQDPFAIYHQKYASQDVHIKGITFNSFQQSSPIKATIKLIAAAKEHQEAFGGTKNSRFTRKLLEVWNDGQFKGTHQGFFDSIRKKMNERYPPAQMQIGAPNAHFDNQTPFTI